MTLAQFEYTYDPVDNRATRTTLQESLHLSINTGGRTWDCAGKPQPGGSVSSASPHPKVRGNQLD